MAVEARTASTGKHCCAGAPSKTEHPQEQGSRAQWVFAWHLPEGWHHRCFGSSNTYQQKQLAAALLLPLLTCLSFIAREALMEIGAHTWFSEGQFCFFLYNLFIYRAISECL